MRRAQSLTAAFRFRSQAAARSFFLNRLLQTITLSYWPVRRRVKQEGMTQVVSATLGFLVAPIDTHTFIMPNFIRSQR